MKIKLIRFSVLCVFALFSANSIAQNEYQAEIGLSSGGSYYLGDANNKLFNNMQFVYGGFLRYNFNPRFALKAELINTSVVVAKYNINNALFAADLCGEFNFFDLEQNTSNRFSKSFSPFIFAGVGMMTDLYINQKFPEPSFPFGIGVKVKLAERWNLTGQWSNRILLFSDNMENNTNFSNPNNLNGSNIFNNDLLSTITVGISYNFWEKPCKCLNNSVVK